jgi:hypothetical protein
VLQIGEVARLAEALAGVRRTTADRLAQRRYHGRLVARQIDDTHLVIRSDFDYRDLLLRQFPDTFSVPARYSKHMMVIAHLASGDAVGLWSPATSPAHLSALSARLACARSGCMTCVIRQPRF